MDHHEEILQECSNCGYKSANPHAFVRLPGGFGARIKRYCVSCWRYRSERRQDRSYVTLVVLAVAGLWEAVTRPGMPLGWLVLNFLLLYLLSFVVTAIHEAGHALTAWVLGMRVFQVEIGRGRPLIRKVFGKFVIQIGKRPLLGGRAYFGHVSERGIYIRQVLCIAAGPLFNLIAFAALYLLDGRPTFGEWLGSLGVGIAVVPVLMWGNIFAFVFNLIPRKLPDPIQPRVTDGGVLIRLLRPNPTFVADTLKATNLVGGYMALQRQDIDEAMRWAEDGLKKHPEDTALKVIQGVVFCYRSDFAQARRIFVESLRDKDTSKADATTAVLLNNVAFTNVIMGRSDLLEESKDYSKKAYELLQQDSGVQSTRGAVLIESGDYHAGLTLLNAALPNSRGPRDRATTEAFIALGEFRCGNAGEAKRHLDNAKRIDPGCFILPRVSEEILNGQKPISVTKPNDPRIKRLLKRYRKGDNFVDTAIDVSNVELDLVLRACRCWSDADLASPKELDERALSFFSDTLGEEFDHVQFDYYLHSYVRTEFAASYYNDPTVTSKPAPESGPPVKIPLPEGTRWVSTRPQEGQEHYEAYDITEFKDAEGTPTIH